MHSPITVDDGEDNVNEDHVFITEHGNTKKKVPLVVEDAGAQEDRVSIISKDNIQRPKKK